MQTTPKADLKVGLYGCRWRFYGRQSCFYNDRYSRQRS